MIVLIGPMGAGKTTVGGLVADRLGAARPRHRPRRRGDAPGATISEIFVDDGEAAFRALERAAVADGARHPRRRARARRRSGARPRHPRPARRPRRRLPPGRALRRGQAGRARHRAARCCSATSAAGSRRCSTSAPRSTSRSPRSSSTPTAATRDEVAAEIVAALADADA